MMLLANDDQASGPPLGDNARAAALGASDFNPVSLAPPRPRLNDRDVRLGATLVPPDDSAVSAALSNNVCTALFFAADFFDWRWHAPRRVFEFDQARGELRFHSRHYLFFNIRLIHL